MSVGIPSKPRVLRKYSEQEMIEMREQAKTNKLTGLLLRLLETAPQPTPAPLTKEQ
jgi:hypothetical protein